MIFKSSIQYNVVLDCRQIVADENKNTNVAQRLLFEIDLRLVKNNRRRISLPL